MYVFKIVKRLYSLGRQIETRIFFRPGKRQPNLGGNVPRKKFLSGENLSSTF